MKKNILMLLILIIAFAVFFPSLRSGFVNWDDDSYIIEDTLMQNLSWQNVKTIFTSPQLDNYHPLSRLSYALEYHFFKQKPFIYHLNNLILHLFNCILVFWFILLLSENIFISFITAILFGIHPLHVESVVWVSERRDVLYSLFFLSALISYLYYIKTRIKKCYYLSIGLFVLSLLSKAMAVTLPFILILIDYLFYNKAGKASFKNKAPFFIITILLSIITLIIRIQAGDYLGKNTLNLYHNIAVACFSLLFYLNKVLMPVKLACIYPYNYSDIYFFHRIFFFILSTLIILLAGTVILSKYSKKIIFGTGFFIITIFPVIQLIPSSGAMSVVSDRYSYIPAIGLFYTFASVLYWIYKKKHKYEKAAKTLIQIILIGIISALSILTYNRCQVWKDSISLWDDVLKNYPNVATAYNSRGVEYLLKGEHAKAYADFMSALSIDQNYYEAYFNLGSLYSSEGNDNEAVKLINKTLQINPDYLKAYEMLIAIYGRAGRHSEVIKTCERVIQLKHNYIQAYINLCSAYGNLGDFQEAIVYGVKAIAIDPKSGLAHMNLSAAYFYSKRFDSAIRHCDEAIQLGYKVELNFLDQLRPYRKQK